LDAEAVDHRLAHAHRAAAAAATHAVAVTVTHAVAKATRRAGRPSSPHPRSSAPTREAPKQRELTIDELTNLRGRRFVEVAPSRSDIECGADFGGDSVKVRAIFACASCAFGDVQRVDQNSVELS
jgi:hypothetical protein